MRRGSRSSAEHATGAGIVALTVSLVVAGMLSGAAGRTHDAPSATNDGAPPHGHPSGTGHQQDGQHHHRPGDQHGATDHRHGDAADAGHIHAPVPPEYESAHVPASAWTNPRLVARGKQIYMERCAVCHGDNGDGKGPAGIALPLKPPDLRDTRMVGEMTGNYWFWRVSEGGTVEPFKSAGSTMPAWKDELSVEDRWAVIVYQHTFSGHDGPHVTSEHPESVMASHAGHGRDDKPRGTTPATGPPTAAPHGSHRH
jgi:mono/diheme cytochrome c family protein